MEYYEALDLITNLKKAAKQAGLVPEVYADGFFATQLQRDSNLREAIQYHIKALNETSGQTQEDGKP